MKFFVGRVILQDLELSETNDHSLSAHRYKIVAKLYANFREYHVKSSESIPMQYPWRKLRRLLSKLHLLLLAPLYRRLSRWRTHLCNRVHMHQKKLIYAHAPHVRTLNLLLTTCSLWENIVDREIWFSRYTRVDLFSDNQLRITKGFSKFSTIFEVYRYLGWYNFFRNWSRKFGEMLLSNFHVLIGLISISFEIKKQQEIALLFIFLILTIETFKIISSFRPTDQ